MKKAKRIPLRMSEDEKREKLAALVLRRTALTESESEFFDGVFPDFMDTHLRRVWRVLARRGIRVPTLDDLTQDVFASFICSVRAEGFPESIPKKLDDLAAGKASNHWRGVHRSPVTDQEPSSSQEQPQSSPDLLRALDVEEFRRRLVPALPPNQLAVVDALFYRHMTQEDAAIELGITRSLLAKRLEKAMRVMREMAALFFSPSQRY